MTRYLQKSRHTDRIAADYYDPILKLDRKFLPQQDVETFYCQSEGKEGCPVLRTKVYLHHPCTFYEKGLSCSRFIRPDRTLHHLTLRRIWLFALVFLVLIYFTVPCTTLFLSTIPMKRLVFCETFVSSHDCTLLQPKKSHPSEKLRIPKVVYAVNYVYHLK